MRKTVDDATVLYIIVPPCGGGGTEVGLAQRPLTCVIPERVPAVSAREIYRGPSGQRIDLVARDACDAVHSPMFVSQSQLFELQLK